MYVKNKKEKILKDDIYFVIPTSEGIIINNNTYTGIICLDYCFNKLFHILYPIETSVYRAYKQFSQRALLLLCPDDDCLIMLDLIQKDYVIIPLDQKKLKVYFSDIYYWVDDVCIIADYNSNFYLIDYKQKKIIALDSVFIKNNYASFYHFWEIVKEYKQRTVYAEAYQCIFQDEKSRDLGFFDFNNNSIIWVHNDSLRAHDFAYHNGIFVGIAEELITLMYGDERYSIERPEDYTFLKAVFLPTPENNMILLSGHRYFVTESKLTWYEITV